MRKYVLVFLTIWRTFDVSGSRKWGKIEFEPFIRWKYCCSYLWLPSKYPQNLEAQSNSYYSLFHDFWGSGIWSQCGWLILLFHMHWLESLVVFSCWMRWFWGFRMTLLMGLAPGWGWQRTGLCWDCQLECLRVASLAWWPQGSKREYPVNKTGATWPFMTYS